MLQYQNLLRKIKLYGEEREDRTGTGTLSLFSPNNLYFYMEEGFPLMTTKKLHFKSIAYELLWFIRGDTNIKFLTDHGVTIWNEWSDENGNLGPVYGKQLRDFGGNRFINGVDQLQKVIDDLRTNPNSRRHVITLWNPQDIDDMALPPCHGIVIQFYVSKGKYLSLKMYQRSVDNFLGLPYNIASYSLLLNMICKITGLIPDTLIITMGDVHIYKNHMEQVDLQLSRQPKDLPILRIHGNQKEIDDFNYEDFEITGYDSYPSIKAEVSV